MGGRVKHTCAIGLLLLVGAVFVRAVVGDVLVTKSGSRYEGTVIDKGDSYVVIRPSGGKMTIPKRIVSHVIKGKAPTTQVGPKPKPAVGAGQLVTSGKRATALIDLGERGSGSAFCIDPAGLFVTNWHVVATLGHGGIVKLVMNAGESDQNILQAAVVGFDRQWDLALLQTVGAKKQPILKLGSDEGLRETMGVTVFGYPFGKMLATKGQPYPNISVNTGKIASLRKQEGKLAIIQIDASVNPGNSGGPVLDAGGTVIGVVVSGLRGSGVNFIIPVSRLKPFLKGPHLALHGTNITYTDRHKPATLDIEVLSFPRTGPTKLAVELVLRGGPGDRRLLKPTPQTGGRFRVKTSPLPKPSQTKQLKISALGEKGLITGWTGDRTVRLRDAQVKLSEIQSVDAAPAARVTLQNGRTSTCKMADLGKMSVEVKDQTKQLDLAGFALVQIDELKRDERMVQYTIIAEQSGKVVKRVEGAIKFAGAPEDKATTRPTGFLEMLQRAIRTPESTDAEVLHFPYDVEGIAAVGGGGNHLVLKLSKIRKVAIFDVVQAKVIGYIPLQAGKVLLAAGAEKLIIGRIKGATLERWDLKTCKLEAKGVLAGVGDLVSIAMGSASAGPLMVNTTKGTKLLVDVATLKPMSVIWPRELKRWQHCRASADGKTFGAWGQGKFPSRVFLLRPGDGRVTGRSRNTHASAFGELEGLTPCHDGSLAISSVGLWSRRLVHHEIQAKTESRASFLPTQHPRMFASFDVGFGRRGPEPRVQLFSTDDQRPICPGPVLWELMSFGFGMRGSQDLGRRILVYPDSNLVATVPWSNDRLLLHRYDFAKAMKSAEADHLFVQSIPPVNVRPGAAWTYPIQVRSSKPKVTYKLLAGPKGMQISETGQVKWQVPSDLKSDRLPLAIEIANSGGRKLVHRAMLKVSRTADTKAGKAGSATRPAAKATDFDLLAAIDIHRDTLRGTWLRRGTDLYMGIHTDHPGISVPVIPRGNYQLTVEFTVKKGPEINVILPVGVRTCQMLLGAWKGSHGFAKIKPVKGQSNPSLVPGKLQPNKRYALEMTVRRSGPNATLQAVLDGKELTKWEGKVSDLSLWSGYHKLYPHALGLGGYKSEVVFHRATLRMLSGEAHYLHLPLDMQPATYLTEIAPSDAAGTSVQAVVASPDKGKSQPCLRLAPKQGQAASAAYSLGRQFDLIRGSVALAGGDPNSSVLFKILGDGKELWQSRVKGAAGSPSRFSVAIGRVDRLQLVVEGLSEPSKQRALWVQPRLVICTENPPIGPDAPIWKKIEDAVKQGNIKKSRLVGGGGGGAITHLPQPGALLIGFNVTFHMSHVRSLQPVYLTRQGRVEGPIFGRAEGGRESILAEPGYAVGGVHVRADSLVRGVHLMFLRITPDGLDTNNWYAWGSSIDKRKPVKLFDESRPVIGIHGRQGDGMDSLGLIFGPK